MSKNNNRLTNIIEVYAGYYLNKEKLKHSSSGGVATALAEAIIERGGIVYGAIYSKDFYIARYGRAEAKKELQQFQGSKYVFVEKTIERDGNLISVYEDVIFELKNGREILFTGLGCDIATIKTYVKKLNLDEIGLYTIELLCDGVTNAIVHQEYISSIEKIYKSKVKEFTVRNKRDGWIPLYIFSKFENGKEHLLPFYSSDYGYAFLNYKKKGCYECPFKEQNHMGDIMVADYWGCRPGMKEYNEDGVSLIYIQSKKGMQLFHYLNTEQFYVKKVDQDYALYYSPRYFNSHEKNMDWEKFDCIIHKNGLHEAVKVCSETYIPKYFKKEKTKKVGIWGTGDCFHRLIPFIRDIVPIACVVDSNEKKWNTEVEYGYLCERPEVLKKYEDIFVLILIENVQSVTQVMHHLTDMHMQHFDYVHNWLRYFEL